MRSSSRRSGSAIHAPYSKPKWRWMGSGATSAKYRERRPMGTSYPMSRHPPRTRSMASGTVRRTIARSVSAPSRISPG